MFKWLRFILFGGAMLLSLTGCSDVDLPSADTMIENLADSMPAIIAMLSAAAYIMGFFFILMGVYGLKQYGELRTMMSSSTSLSGPLITLAVGGGLIFLPTTVDVGMATIFGTASTSPISIPTDITGDEDLLNAVVAIVKVVGIVAFIRGMIMLNNVGGQGAQPGTMGKALTHIVGGLLAINMWGFWEVIESTLMG
jgi:intracellular multiplication protein IcmC